MDDRKDLLASWGGPPDLSAWEALMWRAEGDHRTRSSGVVVELLDQEPDWDRLVAAHERLTRRITRLRDRVVEPPLPLVAPAWSPDPHFDMGHHLKHVQLPQGGSLVDMYAIAAEMAAAPLDLDRPPWESLLVGGLPDGRAAYLFKLHHSLSDGLGMLQLLDMTHGHSREPSEPAVSAPSTVRPAESPWGLLANRLVTRATAAPVELGREAVHTLGRFTGDPVRITTDAIRFGKSLRRVLKPPQAKRSPAFGEGGSRYHFITLDVPLAALKSAAKAAEGSVNDAFLAALLGAVRMYHEANGVDVDYLPIGIPVSLRTDDDPLGGNRFAGARFAAPVGESDPRLRIAEIHELISDARSEPAIGLPDLVAPVLSRLPGVLLTQIASGMSGVLDLQASNMAAIERTFYLAGSKVERLYIIGPRPGVTAMVTMLSYDATCCIGINFDPDAIVDVDGFSKCLHAGFDEVLSLGS
ncbi:wax ester/triacylglycerol synthase domain-containing protein [Mycobacterium sp.]|uniref:wax ester/triacylglycerol synthase domain-containing protein n=1 Tax=Mycobacterium sp. TaxID=1785 RepID=UPI003D13E936